MIRYTRKPVLAALAAGFVMAAPVAWAQGLMSGTGLQPSQQVATPPDAPSIDRPDAARSFPAGRARDRSARAHRPAAGAAASRAPNAAPVPPRS